jgi:hypothetical protein
MGRSVLWADPPTKIMITTIISTVLGIVLTIIVTYKLMSKKLLSLSEEVKNYKFGIKSAYVRFGKTFEQYAPFTNKFTDSERQNFFFLGCPIDGVIFDEDAIKFVEIKTGNSFLSQKQERIKKMINEGKVQFKEVRF